MTFRDAVKYAKLLANEGSDNFSVVETTIGYCLYSSEDVEQEPADEVIVVFQTDDLTNMVI